MAYPNPQFGYRQAQQDSAPDGRRPSYFEDDDAAVLDPAILESDIMRSPRPANTHFRKDSFASNGVLSPPAEGSNWEHQYADCPPPASSAGVPSSYHEEPHGFVRHSISHPPNYAHPPPQPQPPQPQWTSFEQQSGQCTPTNGADFMPPSHFETAQYVPQRTESAPHQTFVHPPHHPPGPFHNMPHAGPGFIPAPQVQTPMSPHSHQDWMAMAAQEGDRRPMPKRMRPNSPPRSIVDLQRRDGIRKKNGRIDIPHERNIHTIDELIDKTTDEDMLKELKQQKRLLRNREAALASRQRKKKHTEDLEIKEKGYAQQINMLEKELADMHLAHNEVERDRQLIWQQKEEARRHIDLLQDEKRDLIMRHTEETSVLRKRIQVLTDQLEHGVAPDMSAAPSSTGFTDFNAEMEALNMGHDWDNFLLVNDLGHDGQDEFGFDPLPDAATRRSSPNLERKSSTNTITPTPSKKQQDVGLEQPIASGLLFMLLLCGAFVASKPASSSRSDLPQMPADVRAAAPTVLNNLLTEAGNQPNSHVRQQMLPSAQREPGPSAVPRLRTRGGPNTMERVHHRLTAPTKQQEIDAAFAMTPSQYASLTDVPTHSDRVQPSRSRRNLADALSNMEQNSGQHSRAEVYTRSLLWDQIPSDVVKQFKEMVRDHDEIEARQKTAQQNDSNEFGDIFGGGYKIER